MPTYSYECSKGHQFEVVQRMTDAPLKRCRVCRAKAQRLILASTFILKGAGWYSDGYSGKGSAGGSSEPSSARAGATSESSSSTSESSSKPSSGKGPSSSAAAAS
jgi:putative FmdB family regulatory protein